MRLTKEPVVLNENDLFLFPTGGQLLSETNELKVNSSFGLSLLDRVDPDTFIILGNKIFRHAFTLGDDLYLFNLCIDRIGPYLVGALQTRYFDDSTLSVHLAWQGCKVLANRLNRIKDTTAHLVLAEQDFDELQQSLNAALSMSNVVIHTGGHLV